MRAIMNDANLDLNFDAHGFADRLAEAMAPEKVTAFAARIGVPQPTISKYLKAGAGAPRLDIAARCAEGVGTSLDWLVWGRGDGPDLDAGMIRVPRYDVSLAAGAGAWNEGKRRLDDIPFTSAFFRKRFNRPTGSGFAVLEARGDSMEPSIADGDLLLIDETDTRLYDGVFGFVLDGEARVKRFRRLIDGVSIISDNPIYPTEELTGDRVRDLQIIGRVRWVGKVM
jgi:hypothetical protein